MVNRLPAERLLAVHVLDDRVPRRAMWQVHDYVSSFSRPRSRA